MTGRNEDAWATTAFLTDRYEITMVEAALRSGRATAPATFEVFTRRLADRRPWGVFAGLGRLVEAIEEFRFREAELAWLEQNSVVNYATLEWLSSYRFGGHVDAYREGELYTAGSPVLTVEGTFAEAVLLETIALSILNFDSAVATAASLITCAAGGRPIIEMGSRRVDPSAAVAAARAAFLAGFASTSNLQAGRIYGIPTAGTASHAFVLAYPTEKEAFAAQVAAFGPGTTLLVDTYDVDQGIRTAVEVAGPSWAPSGSTRATSPAKPFAPGRSWTSSGPPIRGWWSRATSTLTLFRRSAPHLWILTGWGRMSSPGWASRRPGSYTNWWPSAGPVPHRAHRKRPSRNDRPGRRRSAGANGRGGRCSISRRAGARRVRPPSGDRCGLTS